MKSPTKNIQLKMTDPGNPNPNKQDDIGGDPSADSREVAFLAPSEDLTLRVEQIFEEAEELWQWMYNN